MASVTTPITVQPPNTLTDITSGTPTPFDPSTIPTPNPYPPSSAVIATPTYLIVIIAIICFLIVAGGVMSWLKLSASRAREKLYNQRQGMDSEAGPSILLPIGRWQGVGKRVDTSSVKAANEEMPPPAYSERVG